MCSVLTINSLLSLGRLRWLLRLRAMFHTLRLYFIYMRNNGRFYARDVKVV